MSTEVAPNNRRNWEVTPPRTPAIRRIIGDLIEGMPWLDSVSQPVQKWLADLYGQPRQPSYAIKDALNGVWLGHPVHPVLVTIPLGAWTSTLLLDVAWLNNEDDGIALGADASLVLGLLGALGSAMTGATNWMDTDGIDMRTGILHGLINGSITVTNIASLVLRLTGQRRAGITLASIGYLASLFSAYLGGELSYSKGIGVNRTVVYGGSNDFVDVLDEADLVEGKLTRVDAAGIPAVVLKQGQDIYAIAAVCSHLGGPLDEGTVEDGVVQCPWHGSCFRMSDGSVVASPAVYAQPSFEVRVLNGKVQLRRREYA